MSPAVLFRLPDYSAPYTLTVTSLPRGFGTWQLFVPAVVLLDSDFQPTREVPEADFIFKKQTFSKSQRLEGEIAIDESSRNARYLFMYTNGALIGELYGVHESKAYGTRWPLIDVKLTRSLHGRPRPSTPRSSDTPSPAWTRSRRARTPCRPCCTATRRSAAADGHTVKLPMDQGRRPAVEPGAGQSLQRAAEADDRSEEGRHRPSCLDQVIPPIPNPPDTRYVKHVRIQSNLLTKFWGRPMFLGANVLLPEGWDTHPQARYPLVINHGHFPYNFDGFRETPPDPDLKPVHSDRFNWPGYNRTETGARLPVLQGLDRPGLPARADDEIQHANPYTEKRFRGIGQGWARFMCGSTGGWEAMGAQVFYPDQFNGAFIACPDPIDFRAYTTVNLYEDANAYDREGPWRKVARPGHRNYLGHVDTTVGDMNTLELVLGTNGRSGGQWDIWQAVYSPVGANGYPKPIWDKRTGVIDRDVASYWRDHYDLSYILRRDWATLGPKLRGKLHIYVGDMDNYYLNNAVYLVEEFLETAKPAYEGEVDYGDCAEHCWNGDHTRPNATSRLRYHQMFAPKILERLLKTAPHQLAILSPGSPTIVPPNRPRQRRPSVTESRNRGWIVTFAGTGINLALGILYAWSLTKGAIEKDFGWKGAQLNDPYALCCLVFAFAMILAGRCQDQFGPRLTASIGGLLVGAGFLLCSTTNSYAVWLLGFGVLAGIGIGFGYSSATPPALKWFPPAKTGLIAGLVVAGFGLAPVYLAPTSQYLLGHFGVQKTMLILGIAFTAIVCGLAQLLVNPPAGYVAGAKPSGDRSGQTCRRQRHPRRDPADAGVLPAVGDLLHRRRRRADGHRQHQRHGQEEHGRIGVRGRGGHGHRQCRRTHPRRNALRQDRPTLDVVPGAADPGGADVGGHSGHRLEGHGGRDQWCWWPLDRRQLRREPVAVPLLHQGPVGTEDLRHELRRPLHRLGRGRLRVAPPAADAGGGQIVERSPRSRPLD